MIFTGLLPQKCENCPRKELKLPHLRRKTSDFLDINLRTFWAKPRHFTPKKSDVCRIPGGKCRKMPLFLILRYFGPNLVVVASDGLLGALWRLFPALLARSEMGGRKIAHSVVIGSSEAFFRVVFVSSREEGDGRLAWTAQQKGTAEPCGRFCRACRWGEELGSVRVR